MRTDVKKRPEIAVIGAGMAAMAFASRFRKLANISVFEKSRGIGGRMATRRADPFSFDHGAQYFTNRTEAFHDFLQPCLKRGIVKPWSARFATISESGDIREFKRSDDAWVGVPAMNAVAKQYAQDFKLHLSQKIVKLDGGPGNWRLYCAEGKNHGPFDWVVLTAPAPQTANLLPDRFSGIERVQRAKFTPCFTIMLGFDSQVDLPFDAASVEHRQLSWIAANQSKPDRAKATSLTVHASNEWSAQNLERCHQEVFEDLKSAVHGILPMELPEPSYATIHRWRYANVSVSAGENFLLEENLQIAACGDWCIGGRVEAAFTSGHELAHAIGKVLA